MVSYSGASSSQHCTRHIRRTKEVTMNTQEKEYMELHLLWRSEIAPTEDIEIDEAVFEEIYKTQEEKECTT